MELKERHEMDYNTYIQSELTTYMFESSHQEIQTSTTTTSTTTSSPFPRDLHVLSAETNQHHVKHVKSVQPMFPEMRDVYEVNNDLDNKLNQRTTLFKVIYQETCMNYLQGI